MKKTIGLEYERNGICVALKVDTRKCTKEDMDRILRDWKEIINAVEIKFSTIPVIEEGEIAGE